MKIFNSDRLGSLTPRETEVVYNGLDSLLTHEIFGVLDKQLTGNKREIYELERLQLGPVLTLVRRGILIDPVEKEKLVKGPEGLEERAKRLSGMERIVGKDGKGKWKVTNEEATLQRLAKIVWGKPLNYHSGTQLKKFFYEHMRIPVQTIVVKGVRKVSCNNDVLKRLKNEYVRSIPFSIIISLLRDWEKQIDVLNKKLSPEGRWAAGYNIGGTNEGRWSSSDNPLRHSASNQNINNEMRRVFVPDPGYVMVQFDQVGADARMVAYKSGDPGYIRAVESGDSHTIVAGMCWDFEPTRKNSLQIHPESGETYRQTSKILAHGTAYFGKAKTIASQTKIPFEVVDNFQRKFFKAFPGIKDWQDWVVGEVQTKGLLITPFGRVRQFWSRRTDESTWREAIAYEPAATVADLTNTGIYNVWYHLEPTVQLLANGHDAIVLQCPEKDLAKTVGSVLNLIQIGIEVVDIKGVARTMVIPWECSTGHSWMKYNDDPEKGSLCLNGLREYKNA